MSAWGVRACIIVILLCFLLCKQILVHAQECLPSLDEVFLLLLVRAPAMYLMPAVLQPPLSDEPPSLPIPPPSGATSALPFVPAPQPSLPIPPPSPPGKSQNFQSLFVSFL